MTPCRELQSYLCRDMSPERGAAFEQHLAQCPRCQADKLFWERFSGDLEDWTESKLPTELPEQKVQHFMERATRRSRRAPLVKRPLVWVLASGMAAALVAAVLVGPDLSKEKIAPRSPVAAVEVEKSKPTAPIRVFESGHTESAVESLDGDTFGLDVDTRLAVMQATEDSKRLKLERGTAAFDVRHKAANQEFEIQVRQHLVKVVGTRFSVSIQPDEGFDVTVVEGAVTVEGMVTVRGPESKPERVEAGYQLAHRPGKRPTLTPLLPDSQKRIDLLLGTEAAVDEVAVREPVVTPGVRQGTAKQRPLESLSTYRKMILSGRLEEAKTGLSKYVKAHPSDEDGWMLLADCERKFENWPAAVRALKKATGGKDPRTSAKASYMAAELLARKMNRHKQAVNFYEDYLASTQGASMMRTAAKVGLGRSLIALGQKKKARKILQDVVDSPGDTLLEKNAAQLLDSMDPDN